MFDLHRLELLRELRARGTVRAVASALHYSPSTVSQQLSVLEGEAGMPLLEAAGRRVRLTTQGEILAEHADAVLGRLETAKAELARSVDEVSGTVRIAGFQSVFLAVLPALLDELAGRHPQVRVELVQAEPEAALPQLVAHRLDVVVAEEYPGGRIPRSGEVRYRELGRDRLRLAVRRASGPDAPAAAPADAPSTEVAPSSAGWEAVRDRPWVVESEGSASRRWVLDLCRGAGFEPDVRYETDDLLVHERLVAGGHAVGMLPDLVVSGPDSPVVRVDTPGGPSYRRIVVACRQSAVDRPAVRACVGALRRLTRTGAPESTRPP